MHFCTLQPVHARSGRSVGQPIEGIADYDQLTWLMEKHDHAGHWAITHRPIGRFGYESTAEGSAFLSEEPRRNDRAQQAIGGVPRR